MSVKLIGIDLLHYGYHVSPVCSPAVFIQDDISLPVTYTRINATVYNVTDHNESLAPNSSVKAHNTVMFDVSFIMTEKRREEDPHFY